MQFIAYAIIGFTSLANVQPLFETADTLHWRAVDWAKLVPAPSGLQIAKDKPVVSEVATAETADTEVCDDKTVATESPEAGECGLTADHVADCNEAQDVETTTVDSSINPDVERISQSWPELNQQTRAAILMLIEADQMTR